MDEIVIPDRVGWVVGVRGWHVLHPGYLADANRRSIYEPRVRQEAVCLICRSHEAPDIRCSCGFYLVKPSALYLLRVWNDTQHYTAQLGVWGWGYCYGVWGYCYGWGKVIEHEYGWRVQYAYPKELYTSRTDLSLSDQFNKVASRYGIRLLEKDFEIEFPQPSSPPPKPTSAQLRAIQRLLEKEQKQKEMEEFKAWIQAKKQKAAVEEKGEKLRKLYGE